MADGSEVLFQVTRDQLNTGLRGVPVGTCRTSHVDPVLGVSYGGYPVGDLAHLDPEVVVHLLLERRLPSEGERASFDADLRARRGLDPRVIAALRALPPEGHPMAWLEVGLAVTGMLHGTGDPAEDARTAIALAPELVAAVFRLRSGWGEPRPSRRDLGMIEDFVQLLDVPHADPRALERVLRVFYVLHADHGGGNLSTFVGKAVASGRAELFGSLTASMAALSGPLHGGANQESLELVRRVGSADPDVVEAFVRGELAAGRAIAGFGHSVLRAEDARATLEYALGEALCPDDPLFAVARALRRVVPLVLGELPKVRNPYPNVDAVSGVLLHAVGFTEPEYYTVLFGFARISGISSQVVDERARFRGGRGVPLYRPEYLAEDQPTRRL
ncbi:MAG: citrate/2-methylcitrate synthase [Myxococcota bacterium]